MITQELIGKRIAILATDGVEQVELTEPRDLLKEHGATVHIISLAPAGEHIRAVFGWSELGDECMHASRSGCRWQHYYESRSN